jgi:cytochrome c556
MIRAISAATILALGLTAAAAQQDPIGSRRALMKANGAATAAASKMVKGEVPFDLAKAKEVLQTYADAAAKMHTYFPENSKTGGDTIASPKIWENQADFRSRFDNWSKEIEKAKAETKDLDSFKTEFATVTKACASCHQAYRLNRT